MSEKSSIDLQAFYPDSLKVIQVTEEEQCLILRLKSTKHSHCCPKCGQEMSAYHGTYERTVQDLPVFQKKVMQALKHELPTRIAIPNEPKNERVEGDADKKNGAQPVIRRRAASV